MAEVSLTIAGRSYALACRDGGEERLRAIATILDDKAAEVGRSVGGMTEARQLLLAGLLLADEVDELRRKADAAPAPAQAPDPGLATALENLAGRLEHLAAQADAARA